VDIKLWAIQPGDFDKAELVEMAARICYRSEMSWLIEERMEFLEKLAKRGHLSVFEHARYVFPHGGSGPHVRYWSVRYGTNITGPTRTHHHKQIEYLVSWNARNAIEFHGVGHNPVTAGFCDLVDYDDLSPNERLAHASATFEIGGVSRACSHQLVRHRVNSPSQESQRYCDGGEWEPVVPLLIEEHTEALSYFHYSMDAAKMCYEELCEFGISKQDSRFLLPNATPTRLMVTATFEHWRHFLTLRLHKSAQWEIRNVAQRILAELVEVEPELFGDLLEVKK